MADKLKGTCSVCLREMQLKPRGDEPIRHGFSAINVHHGSTGGWHTGPCAGAGYPNLNVSCEGTKYGLKLATQRRDYGDKQLAELATNPPIMWYPTVYKGGHQRPDLSRGVELRFGDESSTSDGRSSYAYEHKKLVANAKNVRDSAQDMINKYERVISTWSPEKYPVTGAAPKLVTTHLLMKRKSDRFGAWDGITCNFTRPGSASSKPVKTEDITKVNCKKCKKSVGLP